MSSAILLRGLMINLLVCGTGLVDLHRTKVKAPSVNSAISVNAEDTCISIFAPDEYTPVPN
jgi:hypothetical protein